MVGVRGSIPLAPTSISGRLREILVSEVHFIFHPSFTAGRPALAAVAAGLIKGATHARDHVGSHDFRPIRPNINNSVVFSGVNAGTDDPKASVPPRPIRPMSCGKGSGSMSTGSEGLKKTNAWRDVAAAMKQG
jgi:hypothetical protein